MRFGTVTLRLGSSFTCRSGCFAALRRGAGARRPEPADASPSFAGHWKGSIAAPGSALAFDVDLRQAAGGALSGDISIPAQNAFDLALGDVTATASRIQFKIVGIPGDPSFDGALAADGARVEGELQAGRRRPLVQDGAGRRRGARPRRRRSTASTSSSRTRSRRGTCPGAGIAIVSGGEVVYAKGFGYRDLEAKKPMTADTLFAIGSTTKAMTATTLGMLVDEGKVEWDEPLRRYLPSFTLEDASISERITPRDIVTHRSGLPRHDLLWYNYNSGTRADMVKRLAHLELTADLREKFQYNNLMFMTAGHLIETLTGESWEQNVRERLFEPLGMTRSNFSVHRIAEGRRLRAALPRARGRRGGAAAAADASAAGEDRPALERIPFRRIDLVGPAGSVNSSVNEMAKWLLFNLRQRQGGGSPTDPGGDARRHPLAADADPGHARARRHLGAVLCHGLGDRHLSRSSAAPARRRDRRLHHLGDVLSHRRPRHRHLHQRRLRATEPAGAARRRPHARARAGRLERRRAGAGREGARGGEDRRRHQGCRSPAGHEALARGHRLSGRVLAPRLRHAAHRGRPGRRPLSR